ncbi:FAD-dependent monooxygenase [Nocardia gipuzkoensis]
MSGIRVLVAGASIAGPALAHWLRRRGAEVTVVERAPELRPGGQAVDARGVAKEVIRRMGLDAAVRAACTDTAGAYTVDVEGNVLETYRADDNGGDGYISEIEILRGDLSRVLYDDTRDGVEYIFGDRIAELTQDADGVDVAFAGGDRRRFDLVVGADGLHSALRAMVFGPRERFVRHLGLVLAFYSVPNEFELDRWLIDYQESGRSAGLRPIPDATRAMAMFSFPAADLEVDYRDVAAQKRLLRERMAGMGWLTPRILTHLDDTPDFYLDQVAQVVMDRWSNGRVGLLGDAAFSSSPMSGAGTGLALVGAYLLAGELAAARWDPEAGFAGYERRMRSFVEANQEIGRLHVRSRDVPGPDTEPSPDFAGEWFTELIERAINGVELPDYAGVPDSGAPAGPPITSSAKP